MLPQDVKLNGNASLWNEMPIHVRETSQGAGRAQVLYGWLRITGMEELNDYNGYW